MKLKIVEFTRKETRTEIDLPVHLYFQDDDCNDRVVKITEDSKTTISWSRDGVYIEVESHNGCIETYEASCITTKEDYDSHLADAIHYIK